MRGDDVVRMYAPAACPHLTGNPDAHSSPAVPSSTTLAAAEAEAAGILVAQSIPSHQPGEWRSYWDHN